MTSQRTRHAVSMFGGIASRYEIPAEVFGFGQYGRWRRFAVERLAPRPGALVLDVATGTGLIARDLARRGNVRVVGLDQSLPMLAGAAARGQTVVAGNAERMPFGDARFGGLAFSYLLRYVDDPAACLRELVRVLEPGAPMASVEFGVPSGLITRPLWNLYSLRVLPMLSGLISPAWRHAGSFLGPSIVEFNRRLPPEEIERLWRAAGMRDVRTRALSFGAGVVTWGRRG